LTRKIKVRLDDVVACQTQFQQFIDGIDHRVHVIGDTVLACRINSAAVDTDTRRHLAAPPQ
jgi:hypothetical protein